MEQQILEILSKKYNLDLNTITNRYFSIKNEIDKCIYCEKIIYKDNIFYIDTDNNVYKHIIKDGSHMVGKYIGKYENNEIII